MLRLVWKFGFVWLMIGLKAATIATTTIIAVTNMTINAKPAIIKGSLLIGLDGGGAAGAEGGA